MIVVIVIVALVLMSIAVSMANAERSNRAWSPVAAALDLEFESAGILRQPRLRGQVEGVFVEADVYSATGAPVGLRTRYRVRHRPAGPRVRLLRQTSLSGLRQLIGGVDVVVGDPFFDRSVVVDSGSSGTDSDTVVVVSSGHGSVVAGATELLVVSPTSVVVVVVVLHGAVVVVVSSVVEVSSTVVVVSSVVVVVSSVVVVVSSVVVVVSSTDVVVSSLVVGPWAPPGSPTASTDAMRPMIRIPALVRTGRDSTSGRG